MKDVIGFEGYYKVNINGEVYSTLSNKILKQVIVKDGVHKVTLYKDGTKKIRAVHRLVAEAFIPNEKNKPQVDHIDGNKSNNHASNLRWCTNLENQAFRNIQGNSGKDGLSKKVLWGSMSFSSIAEAARYISGIRGSKVDTVKKELKAARYGCKLLYGELTSIV